MKAVTRERVKASLGNRSKKFGVLFLMAISFFVSIILVLPTKSFAVSDWLTGWDYRTPIIVGTIATTTSNYVAQIILQGTSSTATNFIDFSKTLPSGTDLRVTGSDKITPLPLWIENWNATNNAATVWVKMSQVSSIASTTVYIYYGNASATNTSNGTTTFSTFYDGFENYPAGRTDYNPGEWPNTYINPTYGNAAVFVPQIASTSAWDKNSSTFAHVLKDGDNSYKMYYWGENGSNRGLIGLATSTDGISWTRYSNNPVIGTTTIMGVNEYALRPPIAWKEGSVYHMMFGVGTSSIYRAISHATSSDGYTWTRDSANPVFYDSQGSVRNFEACDSVIKDRGIYYMYYSGWDNREIGVATSTDLVNWNSSSSPVFQSSGINSDPFKNRFCPGVFKYNNAFYLMVPSISSVGPGAPRMDLYVDTKDPYFLSTDRQFVRTMIFPKADGSDGLNLDTPQVLTDDVTRMATTTGSIYLYYATQSIKAIADATTRWSTSLLITPPGVIDSLVSPVSSATVPPNQIWQGEGPGRIAFVSSDTYLNSKAMSITSTSTVSGYGFTGANTYPVPVTSGTLEYWIKRSSSSPAAAFNMYLYGTGQSSYASALGMGTNGRFNISSGYGSSKDTGILYQANVWYRVSVGFVGSTTAPTQARFSFSIYNSSSTLLYASSTPTNGSFDNLAKIRPIMNIPGSISDTVYIDEIRIRPYSFAEPITTTGSSTVSVFRGYSTIFRNVTNTASSTDYVSYSSIPTNTDSVNLAVTANNGSLDVFIQDWQTSGSYHKEWVASSSVSNTQAIFAVGDLVPNKSYIITRDSATTTTITGTDCSNSICVADYSGTITFTYSGGFSTHTFTVTPDTTSPSSFALSTPVNNANVSNPLTLVWNASTDTESGISKYQLYIDNTLNADNISSTTNSITLSNHLSCGTHTWYVIATDNNSNTTNSDTLTFRVPCPSSSGGTAQSRVNNLLAMGNTTLANQIAQQYNIVIPNQAVAPVTNKTPTFSRYLQLGQTGNDVKQLQIFLNSKGYILANTGPGSKGQETTMFGSLTKKALMKFQKDNKIPSTGYFGPLTKQFINLSR